MMVMKLASLLSGAQCASKVARPRLSGTESTSLDSPEFYEKSENYQRQLHNIMQQQRSTLKITMISHFNRFSNIFLTKKGLSEALYICVDLSCYEIAYFSVIQ